MNVVRMDSFSRARSHQTDSISEPTPSFTGNESRFQLYVHLAGIAKKAICQLNKQIAEVELEVAYCDNSEARDLAQLIFALYNGVNAEITSIVDRVFGKVYPQHESRESTVLRAQDKDMKSNQSVDLALLNYQQAAQNGKVAILLASKFGVKSASFIDIESKLAALRVALSKAVAPQAELMTQSMIELALKEFATEMREKCGRTLNILYERDRDNIANSKPCVSPHYLRIVERACPEVASEFAWQVNSLGEREITNRKKDDVRRQMDAFRKRAKDLQQYVETLRKQDVLIRQVLAVQHIST